MESIGEKISSMDFQSGGELLESIGKLDDFRGAFFSHAHGSGLSSLSGIDGNQYGTGKQLDMNSCVLIGHTFPQYSIRTCVADEFVFVECGCKRSQLSHVRISIKTISTELLEEQMVNWFRCNFCEKQLSA